MKLLSIIFLFNFALAEEYLVYPHNKSQVSKLITSLQAKSVFSNQEKKMLPPNFSKNVVKVWKNSSSTLSMIEALCPGCRIELNNYAKLNNAYASFQWAIDNPGKLIERRISDIDKLQVQARKGEDIQLGELVETSKKIRVAIVDSGIDTNHPDLRANIYRSQAECAQKAKFKACLNSTNSASACFQEFGQEDFNNNGYPFDCEGWNVTGKSYSGAEIEGNADVRDSDGHGTHVAGSVGAVDNEIGIKGVIQNLELLPVQVSTSSSLASNDIPTDNVAKGVLYAIQTKADVINLSLGWRINHDSVLMREMVELALRNNILVVVAAGNDAHDDVVYPCSYEGVICVAAHDADGRLSDFSNRGSHIDLAAPGVDILSTYPTYLRSRFFTLDTDYEYMSGTSQAAPYVSGVLALLLNQGFTPSEAKMKLLLGARSTPHTSKLIRFGNLDFQGALTAPAKAPVLVTKAPAFIQMEKAERSFQFKVYSPDPAGVSISSPDLEFTISEWKIKGAQETTLHSALLDSKLQKKFKKILVTIETANSRRTFPLSLSPIYVITGETSNKRLEREKVHASSIAFSPSKVRAFQNFCDERPSYLGIEQRGRATLVQGIYNQGNSLHASAPTQISQESTLILNLSKVRISPDRPCSYVISRVNLASKERETVFHVFDENFRREKTEVAPGNVFQNTETAMPGKFIWTTFENRMVPTWIGIGTDPLLGENDPWTKPTKRRNYRLYQLTPNGLNVLATKDFIPVGFLFQNDSKDAPIMLGAKGSGHKKQYFIYQLKNNKFTELSSIQTDLYFDFLSAQALPLVGEVGAHAFWTLPQNEGAVRAYGISVENGKVRVRDSYFSTLDKRSPFTRVLRLDLAGRALIQGPHRLTYVNNEGSFTHVNSYTDPERIKHWPLLSQMGVVLPQEESFGLPAHIAIADGKRLLEPGSLQYFAAKECLEIGLELQDSQDYLSFYCAIQSEILKLPLTLQDSK